MQENLARIESREAEERSRRDIHHCRWDDHIVEREKTLRVGVASEGVRVFACVKRGE